MATARKVARPSTGLLTSLVDKQLKARWDRALAAYHAATSGESKSWDARYEALDEILSAEPPYYLAGGYRSAREFLRAEAPGQNERTVRQYIRVARHFDPQDESHYGIAKLEALIDYLEVRNGGKLPAASIDPAKTKVRVTAGGKEQMLWFAQATRAQLRSAARAAQTGEARSAKAPPVVKKIKAALKSTAYAGVAVSVRDAAVTFSGVPSDDVAGFGRVLAKVK